MRKLSFRKGSVAEALLWSSQQIVVFALLSYFSFSLLSRYLDKQPVAASATSVVLEAPKVVVATLNESGARSKKAAVSLSQGKFSRAWDDLRGRSAGLVSKAWRALLSTKYGAHVVIITSACVGLVGLVWLGRRLFVSGPQSPVQL